MQAACESVSVLFLLLLLCSEELNCSSSQWQLPVHQVTRTVLSRQLHKTTGAARSYGVQWQGWCVTHNKTYQSSAEALERYVVWRSNSAYIQYHNNYAAEFGFSLAMNKFGDMVSSHSQHNWLGLGLGLELGLGLGLGLQLGL